MKRGRCVSLERTTRKEGTMKEGTVCNEGNQFKKGEEVERRM